MNKLEHTFTTRTCRMCLMDTILVQLLLSDMYKMIHIHLRDDNNIFEKACISEKEHLIKLEVYRVQRQKYKGQIAMH